MVNPDDAQKVLREHFTQMSLDEFKERREQYVGNSTTNLALDADSVGITGDIILSQPEAAPLKLDAYLACALTGLTETERQYMFGLSDIIGRICQQLDISLYEPRKHTDPVHNAEISSEEVFRLDRERVLGCDLVIHIADKASTGAGEELDFALEGLIPIIIVSHGDSRMSRMVTGIPGFKLIISYRDLTELEKQFREKLNEIRPILEERKLAFSEFDKNLVGNKLRKLREGCGLTREDVAAHSNDFISSERLRYIEENTDRLSNPSLAELRSLATLVKTTVADLVEPDLDERVIAVLQEWMTGRVAERYSISHIDQRRMIRRILYRALDNLDAGP